MRGFDAWVAAGAAQGDVNPATLRPSPLSGVVFLLLTVATVLLLISFVRHLRRAQDLADEGSSAAPTVTRGSEEPGRAPGGADDPADAAPDEPGGRGEGGLR